MSWVIDMDMQPQLGQQHNTDEQADLMLGGEEEGYADESKKDSSSDEAESSSEQATHGKVVIPSSKQIRKATIEGIKIGILPEYQDYGIVLQYLVNQFLIAGFDFYTVQCNVPWFNKWIVNPFHEKMLNEELELAARLEASRINERIMYLLHGGLCSRTCGRCFGCLCCCIPLCAILCKVCAYFLDLCISCVWTTFFDWWLGDCVRKYILFYLCFWPKEIKMRLENYFVGGSMFDDEELNIKNIYDSNSYRIANQYACLLFLTIVLLLLGLCMVIVSCIYLPKHPDQLFIKVESVIGILLFASGCFGLQFYCRCLL
uniref:Caveolin n=1 Tax=Macrostomum lignano TaxID=282301 RepID=A0A1I8J963_9PLAT